MIIEGWKYVKCFRGKIYKFLSLLLHDIISGKAKNYFLKGDGINANWNYWLRENG